MSRLNVLVAPTIDFNISSGFYHLNTREPIAQFKIGSKLTKGTTLFDYKLHSNSALQNAYSFLTKGHAGLDVSPEAPVNGTYYLGQGFYGAANGKTPEARNPIPSTLGELRAAPTNIGCSFYVLTDNDPKLSGAEIFERFFSTIRENRRHLEKWLEASPNFTGNQQLFWHAFDKEEERLSEIECPVIPYDGRDLG